MPTVLGANAKGPFESGQPVGTFLTHPSPWAPTDSARNSRSPGRFGSRRASESSCHFLNGTGDAAQGSWMLRDDTLHQHSERQNRSPMAKAGRGRVNGHHPLRGPPLVDRVQGFQDCARVSLRTEGVLIKCKGAELATGLTRLAALVCHWHPPAAAPGEI